MHIWLMRYFMSVIGKINLHANDHIKFDFEKKWSLPVYSLSLLSEQPKVIILDMLDEILNEQTSL